MGQLLAYSGTATKIRAMHSHLFTNKDMKSLLRFPPFRKLSCISDSILDTQTSFMEKTSPELHRGEIERMLTNSIYIAFQKIYRFASIHQREIFIHVFSEI